MRFFFKRSADFWCPSCGKRGTAQANFCANCGANVRAPQAADAPQIVLASAETVAPVATAQTPSADVPLPRLATPKIVLPALGDHGITAENLPARLALSAPFPRAETTKEILEIQALVHAARYHVLCPEQKAVILRAPKEDEDGVIVAEAGDERWTFTAREAATGKPTSKLWFVAANYPFALSRADQFAKDRVERAARRSVTNDDNVASPVALVSASVPQTVPALLPLGSFARNERGKNQAPFPACDTTEQILAVAAAARAAGYRIHGWEQKELILSAPDPGEKGIIKARAADPNDDYEVVFSRAVAATGNTNSRLWINNRDYPLLGSLKAVLAYDAAQRKVARALGEIPAVSPRPIQERTGQVPVARRGGAITIWRIITHHEQPAEMAEWSRREGVIAVGWGDVGDLREQAIHGETDLERLVSDTYGGNVGRGNKAVQALWRMYREVQIGDLVIVSTGGYRAFVMQINGSYFYVGDEAPPYYEHRRKATVVSVDPDRLWQLSGGAAQGESVRRTLIRCAHTLTEAEVGALL